MPKSFQISEKELMQIAGVSGFLLAAQSSLRAHGEDGLVRLAKKHCTRLNRIGLRASSGQKL